MFRLGEDGAFPKLGITNLRGGNDGRLPWRGGGLNLVVAPLGFAFQQCDFQQLMTRSIGSGDMTLIKQRGRAVRFVVEQFGQSGQPQGLGAQRGWGIARESGKRIDFGSLREAAGLEECQHILTGAQEFGV